MRTGKENSRSLFMVNSLPTAIGGASAKASRVDAVALEPALHLETRLVEGARDGRHVSAVLPEQDDQLLPAPLVFGRQRPRHRGLRRLRPPWRRVAARETCAHLLQREVGLGERTCSAEHDGALDHAAQLTDVSWPS